MGGVSLLQVSARGRCWRINIKGVSLWVISVYRRYPLILYFSDHPAVQSSEQHVNESRVSNLVAYSPLTETSDMSDSVVSSPLSKSIDSSSFTDTAVVNASKSIDPSAFTDTSAKRHVYDSPPTAADQETRAPSKANESRRKTGDKMNVNDVLFGA